MKNISTLKRYLIPSAAVFLLFSLGIILWPEESSHSQIPPPPPPPIPLIQSVLEDIRNTKHNLSSIPPEGIQRNVYTAQTTEICVFCHTPHGAIGDEEAAGIKPPLWNRRLSTASYILYDQVWSTSFEGYETRQKPGAPTGYSRLCLSCHDGTIALGTVINPPGSGVPTEWISTSPGTMPVGSGVTTGDTRFIGTNLQNDHPVSFVYDSFLVVRDEELVEPGPALKPPGQKIGDTTLISPLRRYPGTDSTLYDSVQCTSCHNPHAVTFPKFLRANYYNEPSNPSTGKIICLYCHDKPGWTGSSHDVAPFKPPGTPTSTPPNPYNYDGDHTVGEYACRACHDPHTAQGAKRLLREGVDFSGNFAIENTCYLCHRPASEMENRLNPPPDIRSEFYKDANLGGTGKDPNPLLKSSAMNVTMAQGHEPVFVSRPQEGVELYSTIPPLFNEYTPGYTIQDNAHIECVDCHNPHQVTRTNRLKGMKGIDINGNVVGAKIAGNSREPYVHEICLRCHGNSYTNMFIGYRYPDDTVYRSNPIQGAPTDQNLSMKGYSNKRKEFDPATPDIAPDHTQQLVNPAFHPVAAPGRNGTQQLCNQLAVAFDLTSSMAGVSGKNGSCDTPELAREALQRITITCTDCHNNDVFDSAVKGPLTGQPDGTSYRRSTDFPPNSLYFTQALSNDSTKPQGPHGSSYIRILRNRYNTDIEDTRRCYNTRNPPQCGGGDGRSGPSFWDNFLLCFQCHDQRAFDQNKGGRLYWGSEVNWTNFVGNRSGTLQLWTGNLHKFHLRYTSAYCHECHYNVHSNVEATNTQYGNGGGGELPSDSLDGIPDNIVGTHLINFAPGIVTGKNFPKPTWIWDADRYAIRCDLQCHNIDMYTCTYGGPPGGYNCAAGRCEFDE